MPNFTNIELIRIFYACRADKERREQSEYAEQYSREIEMSEQIMDKIRATGLVGEE